MSFIISSHDLKELVDISDRIVIISGRRFKELEKKNKNDVPIDVSSSDIAGLYNFLKNDYGISKHAGYIEIKTVDINKFIGKLSQYSGKITMIRTKDEKEVTLNDITKAINDD